MKVLLFKFHCLFLLLLMFAFTASAQKQKPLNSYPRVKKAYTEKKQEIVRRLSELDMVFGKHKLILVGLKKEMKLQAWVSNVDSNYYHLYKTFNFCSFSGELGPKRAMGDYQIPEGLYTISYYNPWSNYHLSMKVSYPNKSDKIRGNKQSLGGDIFIHGDCVTIGCIPIDKDIKELFILAAEARKNSRVKVLLLPSSLENNKKFNNLDKSNLTSSTIDLWKELKLIHAYFQTKRNLPKVSITKSGKYTIIQ